MNAPTKRIAALLMIAACLAACGAAEDKAAPCLDIQAPCALPQAPNLGHLPLDSPLRFVSAFAGARIERRISRHEAGQEESLLGDWLKSDEVIVTTAGRYRIDARLDGVPNSEVTMEVEGRAALPGAVGSDDCEAIAATDARFSAWAVAVVEQEKGERLGAAFSDADLALGPADDSGERVVSLGEGGRLTVSFVEAFGDGEGPDFAVFENAFEDGFLELAFVEVSSNGADFARFDSLYLGHEKVDSFGTLDARLLEGLAGKYRKGYGTPFDLARLRNMPIVRSGAVDLSTVRYVRLVDILGDGRETDSFGHPIYDPAPTRDSAGFDLDAVGVLRH